jgi:hypothetical protein
MKTRTRCFNTYLLALLAGLVMLAGCSTDKAEKKEEKKKEKEATTLGMHLEVNADGSDRNGPITLLRGDPITINVNKAPFLTHSYVTQADLVEEFGILGIRLTFTQPRGARLLEYVTGSFKGQRIAIHAEWGEARWLAAPQIVKRIDEGVFTFTPDATKEEMERIVRGLNNVAKEVRKLDE